MDARPTDRVPSSSTEGLVASGHVHDHGSPFGLPRGFAGALAGWYMGLPDAQHRELARVLSLTGVRSMIEIGFGPGQLLHMIHAREPAVALAGVDPSELMLRRARRRNPSADLHLGAAAVMPFADGSADLVVSVNNVPMWPDLDAALVEIDRVLTTEGSALVAWHGGHDPRGHQRKLVLSADRQAAITQGMADHFAASSVSTLQHSVLWTVSKRRPA